MTRSSSLAALAAAIPLALAASGALAAGFTLTSPDIKAGGKQITEAAEKNGYSVEWIRSPDASSAFSPLILPVATRSCARRASSTSDRPVKLESCEIELLMLGS